MMCQEDRKTIVYKYIYDKQMATADNRLHKITDKAINWIRTHPTREVIMADVNPNDDEIEIVIFRLRRNQQCFTAKMFYPYLRERPRPKKQNIFLMMRYIFTTQRIRERGVVLDSPLNMDNPEMITERIKRMVETAIKKLYEN